MVTPAYNLSRYRLLILLCINALLFVVIFFPNYLTFTRPARIAPIESIAISISKEDFAKLKTERDHIIDIGYSDKKGEEVEGTINYKGESFPATFRLRGSNIPHYQYNKWSMHVHLRHKHTLFGVKKFELVAPAARGFYYEMLFDIQLAQEGLLYIDYDFIHVTLNGENMGMMLIHKKTDQLQQRPLGVIAQPRAGGGGRHSHPNVTMHHLNSSKGMNWKGYSLVIENEDVLPQQQDIMEGMLRGFQSGALSASEVFDSESLGRWLAIGELWGAWHGYSWGEMRFYMDPYTMKIEPISNEPDIQFQYQRNSGPLAGVIHNIGNTPVEMFLKDKEVRESFLNNMRRMTETDYVNALTKKLEQYELAYRNALSSDYNEKELPPSPVPSIKARAKIFRRTPMTEANMYSDTYNIPNYINWPYLGKYVPKPHAYAKPEAYALHVRAYKIIKNGQLHLEMHSRMPVDLPGDPPISGTIIVNKIELNTPKGPIRLPVLHYPFTLSPDKPIDIILPSAEYGATISGTLYGHLQGQDVEAKPFTALDTVPALQSSTLKQLSIKELLKGNSFITLQANALHIAAGQWTVTAPIIISNKMPLLISAGAHISFAENAFIRSNGSIQIAGTGDKPVLLCGINGKTWQGIAIIKADTPSDWSHVEISDIRAPEEGAWRLRAGITFYLSDATIHDSSFINASADSMLDISRSRFTLQDITLQKYTHNGIYSFASTGSLQSCSITDTSDTDADAVIAEESHIKLRHVKTNGHVVINGVQYDTQKSDPGL